MEEVHFGVITNLRFVRHELVILWFRILNALEIGWEVWAPIMNQKPIQLVIYNVLKRKIFMTVLKQNSYTKILMLI